MLFNLQINYVTSLKYLTCLKMMYIAKPVAEIPRGTLRTPPLILPVSSSTRYPAIHRTAFQTQTIHKYCTVKNKPVY